MRRLLKAPTEVISDKDLGYLPYPVIGSPKLDGFRCAIDKTPKTSSMKPQPNPFVFSQLSDPTLDGLDGELVIGKPNDQSTFNNSTGPLRRQYGEPDFTFYVFDSFLHPQESYAQRWLMRIEKEMHEATQTFNHPRVKILPQIVLKNSQEVIDYTNLCIADNYEGAMIRTLTGIYKQGRSTFNEMNIFKRKVLSDAEATIIGFNEKMINYNPQKLDEMGLAKRSSHKANKVPAGTLGSFILSGKPWKKPFNCRGKIDDDLAQEIWNNQDKYLGKQVTYKYHAYGSIDAPRQPIFHRFYEEI